MSTTPARPFYGPWLPDDVPPFREQFQAVAIVTLETAVDPARLDDLRGEALRRWRYDPETAYLFLGGNQVAGISLDAAEATSVLETVAPVISRDVKDHWALGFWAFEASGDHPVQRWGLATAVQIARVHREVVETVGPWLRKAALSLTAFEPSDVGDDALDAEDVLGSHDPFGEISAGQWEEE